MKPPGKNVYWAAIGVVSRIGDELIVEADFCRGGKSVAVIGLDDLLQPGMWQLAVADDNPQASGVEIGGVGAENAIDDACDANRVVRPVPRLALSEPRASIVRSMSVLSHGSTLPSAQPARANKPTVSVTCCSRLRLTPGRL